MAELFETAASLRIMDDNLDPDEITAMLKALPTQAWRKGDIRKLPNGSDHVETTGSWRIDNIQRQRPGNLDIQITTILDRCTQDMDAWRSVTSRYHSEIFAGLFLSFSMEGLGLRAETLAALGYRGLGLDLDIYSGSDGDQLRHESAS